MRMSDGVLSDHASSHFLDLLICMALYRIPSSPRSITSDPTSTNPFGKFYFRPESSASCSVANAVGAISMVRVGNGIEILSWRKRACKRFTNSCVTERPPTKSRAAQPDRHINTGLRKCMVAQTRRKTEICLSHVAHDGSSYFER
jgi:hypothetical protein